MVTGKALFLETCCEGWSSMSGKLIKWNCNFSWLLHGTVPYST